MIPSPPQYDYARPLEERIRSKACTACCNFSPMCWDDWFGAWEAHYCACSNPRSNLLGFPFKRTTCPRFEAVDPK